MNLNLEVRINLIANLQDPFCGDDELKPLSLLLS